jgi:hypothetical protein
MEQYRIKQLRFLSQDTNADAIESCCVLHAIDDDDEKSALQIVDEDGNIMRLNELGALGSQATNLRALAAHFFGAITQEPQSVNSNSPLVPIGVPLPWLKSLSGVPQTLPDCFVECNGQTIDDEDSPLDGVMIPNLNGGNLYLRGNTTSGGTGGARTYDLTHQHVLGIGTSISTVSGDKAATTEAGGLGAAVAIEPPYYDVVMIIRIK